MLLSIIIPTKDRGTIFNKTLSAAFSAMENLQSEIIVVNDSKKNFIEIPGSFNGKVRLYSNPKNGVASSRNLGASHAKGEFLLFLDDDILISEKNLSDTLSFLTQAGHENVCLNLNWEYPPQLKSKLNDTSFGRYLVHSGFTHMEGKGWLNHTFAEREKFQVVTSAASFYLAMRKSLFEKVGGYSEIFSHAGFEDYDFAAKLKKNGIDCFILPSGFVYHNEEDRLDLREWMKRKVRGGITLMQAANAGYAELRVKPGFLKRTTYHVLVRCKSFLFFIEKMIPNSPPFDHIYFRFMNLLLGTSIFEGYFYKEKK